MHQHLRVQDSLCKSFCVKHLFKAPVKKFLRIKASLRKNGRLCVKFALVKPSVWQSFWAKPLCVKAPALLAKTFAEDNCV